MIICADCYISVPLFVFKRWETPSSRHSAVLLWSQIRKARVPSRSRSHLHRHGSPETPSPVSPSVATAGNGTVRRRSRPRSLRSAIAWPVIVLFLMLLIHAQGEEYMFSPVHLRSRQWRVTQFQSTPCASRSYIVHHISRDISRTLLFSPAIIIYFRGVLARLPGY